MEEPGAAGAGGNGFDLSAWTAGDVGCEAAPAAAPAAAGAAAAPPPDWPCPQCGASNFARKTACHKCGAARGAPARLGTIGVKDRLPGPPGLFKPGDWVCIHCGNVNWARRGTCNVCNAARATVQSETRTGRGGGHFDLQDPRDKLHHDSDHEEFDEFGRRKRKRRARKETAAAAASRSLSRDPGEAGDDGFGAGAGPGAGAGSGVGAAPGLPSPRPGEPAKDYFPPPPKCYLRGRTMSMDSLSSVSDDYHEEGDGDSSLSESDVGRGGRPRSGDSRDGRRDGDRRACYMRYDTLARRTGRSPSSRSLSSGARSARSRASGSPSRDRSYAYNSPLRPPPRSRRRPPARSRSRSWSPHRTWSCRRRSWSGTRRSRSPRRHPSPPCRASPPLPPPRTFLRS